MGCGYLPHSKEKLYKTLAKEKLWNEKQHKNGNTQDSNGPEKRKATIASKKQLKTYRKTDICQNRL